jgi:hypothetical protein
MSLIVEVILDEPGWFMSVNKLGVDPLTFTSTYQELLL